MLERFSAVLFTLLLFFDITHASEDKNGVLILGTARVDNSTALHIPNQELTHAISVPNDESQRLFSNNTSLTAGTLFHAYMSSDPDQRRLSEMYILGVIDSSEGDSWCGYGIASPSAIQEQLYVALKNSADIPSERASTAIKSHFNKILPCKE